MTRYTEEPRRPAGTAPQDGGTPKRLSGQESLGARIEAGIQELNLGDSLEGRAVRELLEAGGKRLRPRLVHLAGAAAGAPVGLLDRLAAAAELVHVASLLHDDLMDGAPQRRGRPTAWTTHGPSVAVLAGDLAYIHALELVEAAPPPILSRLVRTIDAMVRSQSLENASLRNPGGGLGGWEAVALGKTAALCAWCAEAGGLAAGEAARASALASYGRALGLAFQAQDDMLDLLPTQAAGKTPFADLRAGVPSLPIRLATAGDPLLAEAVTARWAEGGGDDKDLSRRILEATAHAVGEYMEGKVEEAGRALQVLPPGAGRDALQGVLAPLLERAAALPRS